MKQLLLGVFIIVSLVYTSCKSGGSDPKSVLTGFFEALSKKDIAAAKKLATKSSEKLLSLVETGMKMEGDKNNNNFNTKDMEFGEPKIEGDKATIPVKHKIRNETVDFVLKKEDGSWKVAFDKEMIMMQNEMNKKKNNMENKGMDEMKEKNNTNATDTMEKENINEDSKTNNVDSHINLENFNKIKNDMSYDDIVKMLGGDKGIQTGGGSINGKETVIYSWKAGNNNFNKYITLTFDRESMMVVKKEQKGL